MSETRTNSTIKFFQTRLGKLPLRANKYDAGIDFFVPTFTSDFIKSIIEKNQFILKRKDNCVLSETGSANAKYVSVTCRNVDVEDNQSMIVVKFDNKIKKSFIELFPHERLLIPSGISCKMMSNDRALIAANKSGIASEFGLVVGASVVDSQYQGEIHLNVINTSNEVVKIYEDMKLIQMIETPIYVSEIESVKNYEDLYGGEVTSRGTGGFGSTNKKA